MSGAAYRVLARKYRPSNFAELIGHDTLVRTLTNAFASGRIAHAFMLTGVRGVGKTTVARIIARALNCVGPDGAGGPTTSPCGICDPCRAIAEDRHPDVIEMDAASRTGVDDMRELLDGVRYRPVQARFKIYIIDEVHMLSKSAFNALLKTLEEPPPDIKFVFATTEINKVPVTVLSRCQRYTLPRIPAPLLAQYFGEIAAREAVGIEPAALALIARAADGSVRDGLSILDQAIALGAGAAITEPAIRDMLGVADRGITFDLFEALMRGDAAAALGHLAVLYNGGTDPVMVLQDLLDVTHFLTRLKLEQGQAAAPAVPLEDGQDRRRGLELAGRLGMASLARSWQMLLKGLAEVQTAPQPLNAAEMALIRLVYVSDLPPPAEILKALQRDGGDAAPRALPSQVSSPPFRGERPGEVGLSARTVSPSPHPDPLRPQGRRGSNAVPQSASVARPEESSSRPPQPESFAALMALVAEKREAILYDLLASHLHLVRFEPGKIEFRPTAEAPRDLAQRLGQFLQEATGTRWMISVSQEPGAPTLRRQVETEAQRRRAEIEAHPLIRRALALFPGSRIDAIRGPEPETPPLAAAPPEEKVALVEPALWDEDDPGPFEPGAGWDPEDEAGEDA
jgi:DNA polymerase-3 subunit gamma/tau